MHFRLLLALALPAFAAEPAQVIDLWPGTPPGEMKVEGPEQNTSKPGQGLVAGRDLIRLANVAKPQLHLFLPPKDKANGTCVLVCPGGAFNILAWDLEGTEVAEWLNSIGVAAAVLKYRVPTGKLQPKWLIPQMDGQRAISLVRSRAQEWSIDPARIGVLGFSAGGCLTVQLALDFAKRAYAPVDDIDKASCRPDFAAPIYHAYSTDDTSTALRESVIVPKNAPPFFFVHAWDDRIDPRNSLLLATAAKAAGIPCELHIYDTGGHGYGLRPVAEKPVTTWPARCAEWMGRNGWLKRN
ncbi:MAG: alpha/beta hydrolase [Chthoniobacteraceae bacterium]